MSLIDTIIKGIGSVPPAFYVTGLAVISLIIITIRIGLIIQAPYSEFSMNSVKTLMRWAELSFVILFVSLPVGFYGIRPRSYDWWFLVFLCFIALFFAIQFCEFIINNPVNPRTKKQELRETIRFIIAALIIVINAALIVLFELLKVLFFVGSLLMIVFLLSIALDEKKR